ncbi:high affinity methionine permease [Ganoderma leucocontextum]|nr:high affinity methionine permease [Ganoderma leucocontextum]
MGQDISDDSKCTIPRNQVDVKERPARDDDSEQLEPNLASAANLDLSVGGLSLEEDAAGGIGRHMGVFTCTLLIIGRMIGTAIFSTPSSILGSVGSVGASLMLWVFGFVISICGLFIWLEFGTMFPRSGGEKVYLEAVYKKPKYLVTILFAFNAIILGFTASSCIVFAQNILITAGHPADRWVTRAIALAVIVFATLVHGLTPKLGLWLMNALNVFKIVILLFISFTGWAVLAGKTAVQDPHANFRNVFAGSSRSSNDYATAMFKVLNAYEWMVERELRPQQRQEPYSDAEGRWSTWSQYQHHAILPCERRFFRNGDFAFERRAATKQEITESGVTVASLFFHNVFGTKAQKALTVSIALSVEVVMTVAFAAARVNQELAKEGIPLPFGNKLWASNWPTGKSPLLGLVIHMIPSVIVLIGPPPAVAYPFIIDIEGYPQQIVNFFVVIGLFWLRYHKPNAPRPFKVWLPMAVFFLVAAAFLIVAPFLRPANGVGDTPPLPYYLYCLVGIAVLATGVIYWAAWRIVPKWFGYKFVPKRRRSAMARWSPCSHPKRSTNTPLPPIRPNDISTLCMRFFNGDVQSEPSNTGFLDVLWRRLSGQHAF